MFLVNLSAAQAQLASPWLQQMSAEQVIKMPSGKSITSKIYVDNGKVRIDVNANGMAMSTIMRPDKKIMYTLMPAQKMVMEIPMTPKDEDSMRAFNTQNLHFEPVGQGIQDGVECDKYKLAFSTGRAQIFWINKQTKTPVLMEAEDGSMRIEWHNVVPGPQPAALFEPPTDYKKMSMPVRPMPSSPPVPPPAAH